MPRQALSITRQEFRVFLIGITFLMSLMTSALKAQASKTMQGDFDAGKALKLLYGSYNAQDQLAEWQPTADELQWFEFDAGTSTLYTSVSLAEQFRQNGVERYFVLTETMPPDYTCHACAPAIGGALFSQDGDAWRLDLIQKLVVKCGEYGTGPEVELIQIGPEQYGVLLRPMYTGTFQEEGLILIAEVGNALKDVLTVELIKGEGQNDAEQAYHYDSDLQFVEQSGAEFADLHLLTKGTVGYEDKLLTFREEKQYRFARGEYWLAQGTFMSTVYQGMNGIFNIKARQGMHLKATVATTAPNNDVVFWIESPGGQSLMADESDVTTEWADVLPETGEYRINVGVIESDSAEYTLQVETTEE